VRRARQNKSPRSDAIIVKGTTRISGNVPATSGVVNLHQSMDPYSLGDRTTTFAQMFQRYRVKSYVVKISTGNATTQTGNYVASFTDDAEAPTLTVTNALNTRIHTTQIPAWKSSVLRYTPLDPLKWYYTIISIDTGGDNRFVAPSFFYLISDINIGSGSVSNLSLDVDWVIEFEGATDTAL
jgi:hypothetical protein